ncbi:hypothetical protein GC173_15925 [bacterium]|nr:hypothetical protein [bacterium]
MKQPAVRPAAIILAALISSLSAAQTFTEVGLTVLGNVNYDSRSASFADIDNDGDPDLLFQGGGPGSNRDAARQLFRNDFVPSGTLGFTNISASAGISSLDTTGWSAGWADVDGDGFIDVYLGQQNTSVSGFPDPRGDLFRNLGDSTFSDISSTTINDPGFVQNVGWTDVNNDGMLDLVLGMEGPEMHELYLQQEDGSFLQLGASVGLQVPHGTKAYGMAMADPDKDGDIDIYISTCQGGGNIRNNFFENRFIPDGQVFFEDIADTNGTQYMDNTYHAEFVDFDNDGWLDLFVIGADQFGSKIFHNNQDGTYTDVDEILGHPLIDNTGADLNGGKAVDYDNDGDLDLFFHDHLAGSTNVARLLYRNDGDWQFTNVTTAEGLSESNRGSYDSPWADIDMDGDLDLVGTTGSSVREKVFLSNASENGNNWLFVSPRANGRNTRALGAQIYVTVNAGTPEEVTYRRECNTNSGTFNQSDLPIHFGLGQATVIDTLRIVWPDQTETSQTNVTVNQRLIISEPAPPTGGSAWFIQ